MATLLELLNNLAKKEIRRPTDVMAAFAPPPKYPWGAIPSDPFDVEPPRVVMPESPFLQGVRGEIAGMGGPQSNVWATPQGGFLPSLTSFESDAGVTTPLAETREDVLQAEIAGLKAALEAQAQQGQGLEEEQLLAQMFGGLPSGNARVVVPGQAPPPLGVPEQGPQYERPDFTAALKLLEEAAPQAPTARSDLELLSALLGGAATGAAGAMTTGQALAGAGGAGLQTLTALTERGREEQERFRERQQEYRLRQAQTNLEVERARITGMNEQARSDYEHLLRRYEAQMQNWQARQAKVDVDAYGATIRYYDDKGNLVVEQKDNGRLNAEIMMKLRIASLASQTKDPWQRVAARLQPFFQSNDPLTQATAAALHAWDRGIIQSLLTEDELAELLAPLMEQAQLLQVAGVSGEEALIELQLARARILGAQLVNNEAFAKQVMDHLR